MLGGAESSRHTAAALLSSLGNIVDMGDDVGAANVVKLCGNFLIAVGWKLILYTYVFINLTTILTYYYYYYYYPLYFY